MDEQINENFIIRKVKKYHFYDGVIQSYIENYTYDNWLSSSEFGIYEKSIVKIEELNIELFSKKNKPLTTFNEYFKLDNLKLISRYFDMSLYNSPNNSFLVTQNHSFDNFYISLTSSKLNNFVIIYGIGGSRFPESIYIHGIWELVFIPIQLKQE